MATWWPAGRAGIGSALGTAGIAVLGVMDLVQHYEFGVGGSELAFPLTLARVAPLLLAWSRPVLALAVSLPFAAVTSFVLTPVSPSEPWPTPVTTVLVQVVLLVVLGLRGKHGEHGEHGPARRRLLLVAGWVAAQAPGVLALSVIHDRADWSTLLAPAIVTAVAAIVGELVGGRASLSRRLARQRAESEAERDRRARLEERARLARELHDVVAHHLSVVVARADSAPHRLTITDDAVRDELAAIAEDARASMNEMRHVLRLLRENPEGERRSAPEPQAPREPLPGLGDLAELVDAIRRTGARVTLAEPLPREQVAAVASLTTFRVVQEALTNALRHAPGAPVDVAVRHEAGALHVTVHNGPPSGPPLEVAGSGQGLRGVDERVTAAGGRATAEPTDDGGFLVTATIPTGDG